MMKYQPKLNLKKCTPSLHWVIPEKFQAGGLRIWNFLDSGIKISMWNFQGTKKKLYGISRDLDIWSLSFQVRCNTVLCNFQEWSFDLPGISRGKVNKWKIPGGVRKSMSSTPPPLCFFFRNSSFHFKFWRYFLYLITCKVQPLVVSFLVVLC